MNTLDYIESVNFQEKLSFIIDNSSNFSFKTGAHFYVNHPNKQHKLYISENFKTNLHQYYLYSSYFEYNDLTAFHIFRYINERCHLPKYNHRILWLLLRKNNSTFQSIIKFILLKYFYKLARETQINQSKF